MQVGFLQFAPQERKIEENISFIINETKHTKNAFIVLPELFLTSYTQITAIEKITLRKILSPLLYHTKQNNLSFVGSIAVKSNGIAKNQGIYMTDGKVVNTYAKRKLYDNEKKIFQAGKKRYEIFSYEGIPFTMQICIDNINPSIARHAAQRGVLILTAPSTVSVDFLQSVLKARSLENQHIVIFANRVGKDINNIIYCGLSTIFLPNGVAYSADKYNTSLQIVSITKVQIKQFMKTRTMLLQEDYAEKRSRTRAT